MDFGVEQAVVSPAAISDWVNSFWWHTTTLPEILGLADADKEDDLYDAIDWQLERQGRIERKLAARHLADDALAL